MHKLLPEERSAIVRAAQSPKYLDLRHRKLAYQLPDDGVAFVSPSTVYQVLKAKGLIHEWEPPRADACDGELKVTRANQMWHTDITYIPIGGSYGYLISVLDGYSRYIVHHELCLRRIRKNNDIVPKRIEPPPQFCSIIVPKVRQSPKECNGGDCIRVRSNL